MVSESDFSSDEETIFVNNKKSNGKSNGKANGHVKNGVTARTRNKVKM